LWAKRVFFRTIEAHTDAPIVSGNRIDVLFNGDETFPAMLRDIRKAKFTITFAHPWRTGRCIITGRDRQSTHLHRKPQPLRPLLLGGIQLYEYKASLMHAKTIVVDGVWSTIGSTNFDNRSFALNQEINLTVYDRGAYRLEQIFQEDLKYSQQISYEQWRSRSLFERVVEMFAFPIREQL
jgi:phosphatidylserine/phosphatidylglycerophosphate/cardiolipin synthase-like enzyme